ncbi:MAG: NusG domain II-containing protein [Negativicutes bacterium]|nr:NusG domain II-containing protein [Negativicutes bacterium]
MRLTWADKIAIGLLLAFSLGGIVYSLYFMPVAGLKQAEISVDGRPYKTVLLRPGYKETFRIGGASQYNVIEADGARIRVLEADCPDQICVKTGWVRQAPQQIVCLPWRTVIRVTEAGQTDIDEIAR